MVKKFYVTTAIPYVNAKPHVGHALEFVQADTIARYHRLLGEDVLLLSGGDENALKNVQAAEAAGVDLQTFIDTNTQLFKDMATKLDVHLDVFQKGSDRAHHYVSSQKLWQLCDLAGDIYKKSYEGLYCVGCEAFYTPDELNENGECFEHPGKKLEKIAEENYFFRLSAYQQQLTHLIASDALKIIPEHRKNEMLGFLRSPLQDISISRTNERARNWGVPVPGDDAQRMYVWFDALNIYQSGIGFGWDEKKYKRWWPADVHVIGKGIIRFHAIYWPAFLLSANLPLPKTIFVHGYFTIEGQKMAKTLGNVIDPLELLTRYHVDSLRYYFLREMPAYSDGDFSERRFKQLHNADLSNGLGNLVARVAKLASGSAVIPPFKFQPFAQEIFSHSPYQDALDEFRFHDALAYVWEKVRIADKYIDDTAPWKLTGKKLTDALTPLVSQLLTIATLLQPFLPQTAEKILEQFKGPTITSQPPLFPRIA